MGDPLLIHPTARKMARDRDGDGCGTLGITGDILWAAARYPLFDWSRFGYV
jgi:hypothetical protein